MTIAEFSQTPALNASAITGVNLAENEPPSAINDAIRQICADIAVWYAAVDPAGRIEQYGGSSAPTGWLECDGSAVSRATYARLFTAVSTTWGVGDGSTTFNLPDFRGRVLVGKGTGTLAASGTNADVDTAADTLTVASNNTTWITGMAVVFTLASGTITGLTSGNTYYVIRSSATLVKLASSLANAIAGTQVDMTAKSSPVWTITATLTTRTLAEKGGEETHALTAAEIPPLSPSPSPSTIVDPGTGSGAFGNLAGGRANGNSVGTLTISISGSGGAANLMQSYGVTMFIIRT
jgi:microcystin-dependent protein